MRPRFARLFLVAVLGLPSVARPEDSAVGFRRGNESASHSKWDDAISEYSRLAQEGVKSPSLYWNWAQAASASGRKGEALWALLRAQEQTPGDASLARDIERIRGELGLDPSEVSLGLLGDVRLLARRLRFDVLAIAALLLSIASLLGRKPRKPLALSAFLTGVVLITPYFAGAWREPRGVVVQRDAPLLDAPRNEAVALANLREGEVVPLLGEEGDCVRIQDASGARGFAHRSDVRRIGRD
jgi:hypothetical protein